MSAPRITCTWWGTLAIALMMAGSIGCQVVSRTKLTACETQHRSLSEQNKAVLAENENLKTHSRQVEDRLIRAEEELAALDERSGLDRKRLTNYEREREALHKQFGDPGRSGK